jgi:hypothetical protein
MQVNPKIRHALIAVALVLFASTCIAFAQGAPKNAPPSYVADPAVYKLIGENEQYVVIMAERATISASASRCPSPPSSCCGTR